MAHYVMDSYVPDRPGSEALRREVIRVIATDDQSAIAEAQRLDHWKHSSYFEVRYIKTAVRSGDKVIFSTKAGSTAAL
jgi:hypothetical protein